MNIRTLLGLAAGSALLLVACGDDGASSDPTVAPAATVPGTEAPVATAATGDTTPADGAGDPEAAVASRILSLSPTATEMIFAIGAGDQVVAVDSFSNHPPEAAAVLTEIMAFEPNVEAIAEFEPDLVLTDGTNPDLLAQLDSLGIPHWEGPAAISFDDVYTQIEQLGVATGHVADAAELVASMQTEIDALLAGIPELEAPLRFYHELDPTYFSVTSDTFIGYVYNQFGLVNIADLAEGNGGAYPQLNAEFIISADPDLIFQACTKYCGETAETMSGRPGWDAISAIASGAVIELDDDIASRWGPRVVDFLRSVAEAIDEVASVDAAG